MVVDASLAKQWAFPLSPVSTFQFSLVSAERAVIGKLPNGLPKYADEADLVEITPIDDTIRLRAYQAR